ncbi:MAG: hypothetical protein CSA50_00010 [Gammaproteobacteria bacterium]|nr:MAG: hypothetical protein CSA50_00010 [Gammaproteobacteria bacterium]
MVVENRQVLSRTQQNKQTLFLADGRYALFEVIASTALVTFYHATDTQTLEVDQSSSRVVVGIINPILQQVNGFSEALPRVLDEFSDPVVNPYVEQHGLENGQYWYVLPNPGGTPLYRYIHQTGRFGYPVPDVLNVIESLVTAVRQSPLKKEFGYLEPGAIYYEVESNQSTLINSPVATALNLVSQSHYSKESDRPTLHSGYLSLEVALGKNPTDYDDSFSLAAIAYQMLNGHLPFVNDHTVEAAFKKTIPAAIAKLEPESSRVMLNALAFQREQRPANGEELLYQLQNPPPLPKEPGRLSGWIKLSAAAVLLMAGVAFAAFSYVNPHNGKSPSPGQRVSANIDNRETQHKLTELQQQYEQEVQKLTELKQQQQEETQRLSELKQQQHQEAQRLATLKQQQKLAVQETKSIRQTELKEERRIAWQKKQEAKKRRAEAQKKTSPTVYQTASASSKVAYPDPAPRLLRKVNPRFFNPGLFGKIPASEQAAADQSVLSVTVNSETAD